MAVKSSEFNHGERMANMGRLLINDTLRVLVYPSLQDGKSKELLMVKCNAPPTVMAQRP